MESIFAAAAKYPDGTVLEGKSHEDTIDMEKIQSGSPPVMGFTTTLKISNKRRFVDRDIAENIAIAAGQIPERWRAHGGLSSEELWWWPEDPYKWNPKKGYYKDGEKKETK